MKDGNKRYIRFFLTLASILFFELPIYAQETFPSFPSNLIQKVLSESLNDQSSSSNNVTSSTAIPEPKPPSVPDSNQTHKTSGTAPKINTLPGIHGTIIASDNQKFDGTLYLPSFSLKIQNSYQGKDFLKILPSSQIQSLTCIQWSSFPYQQQSESFQFVCTLYNIKDKEGNNHTYNKVIPALSQITFRNNKGTTLFYFYFIDYIKKDIWENLRISSKQTTVSQPLKGVIRSIVFSTTDTLPSIEDYSPTPSEAVPIMESSLQQEKEAPTDTQAQKKAVLKKQPAKPRTTAPIKPSRTRKTASRKQKVDKEPTAKKKLDTKKADVSPTAQSSKDVPSKDKQEPIIEENKSNEKVQIRSRR